MDRRTVERVSNVGRYLSISKLYNNESFSKSIILCMFNPLLERWIAVVGRKDIDYVNYEF